jgi:hypothetical protein
LLDSPSEYNITSYDLYKDGLKIHHLDVTMQRYARKCHATAHMKSFKQFENAYGRNAYMA